MGKSIYKYVLKVEDFQETLMPEGTEILTAQVQNEEICMWAMVYPERKTEKRFFRIVGTGQPLINEFSYNNKYISTVQMAEGKLVWHIFEIL